LAHESKCYSIKPRKTVGSDHRGASIHGWVGYT
jgi:hypothetical protein